MIEATSPQTIRRKDRSCLWNAARAFYFPQVTAERVLKDWDVLTLGNIKMTALLGAGHTRGATTWVTTIEDGGRSYNVVFPCCTSVNPLYRLAVRPSYPGIADDYPPDVPHA